jgi:hypothetical protein
MGCKQSTMVKKTRSTTVPKAINEEIALAVVVVPMVEQKTVEDTTPADAIVEAPVTVVSEEPVVAESAAPTEAAAAPALELSFKTPGTEQFIEQSTEQFIEQEVPVEQPVPEFAKAELETIAAVVIISNESETEQVPAEAPQIEKVKQEVPVPCAFAAREPSAVNVAPANHKEAPKKKLASHVEDKDSNKNRKVAFDTETMRKTAPRTLPASKPSKASKKQKETVKSSHVSTGRRGPVASKWDKSKANMQNDKYMEMANAFERLLTNVATMDAHLDTR